MHPRLQLSIASLAIIATAAVAFASESQTLSAAIQSKIERDVVLDDAVQAQVRTIDALTVADLPAAYRNRGYLEKMAETSMAKATDAYDTGIRMRSMDAASEGLLPSDGQAGAYFQQAKVMLHAYRAYTRLARQL